MTITIYKEPEKTKITEKNVLDGLKVIKHEKYSTVSFKNLVIIKINDTASLDEVREYLKKEGKQELKNFLEKYKTANEKRAKSIKERNSRIKEIKKQVDDEEIRQKYIAKKAEKKK